MDNDFASICFPALFVAIVVSLFYLTNKQGQKLFAKAESELHALGGFTALCTYTSTSRAVGLGFSFSVQFGDANVVVAPNTLVLFTKRSFLGKTVLKSSLQLYRNEQNFPIIQANALQVIESIDMSSKNLTIVSGRTSGLSKSKSETVLTFSDNQQIERVYRLLNAESQSSHTKTAMR